MLEVKDELLFDFQINRPRILLTDKLVIIDEVERLMDFTDTILVAISGKVLFTVVSGENLMIDSFQNQRLVCSGTIRSIEFRTDKKTDEG